MNDFLDDDNDDEAIFDDYGNYLPGFNRLLYRDPFPNRVRTPTKGASHVVTIESQKGYWSGNNQFGNLALIEPDDNDQQTILKLDEMGFPRLWTVSLGIAIGADLETWRLSGDGYSVQAIINFGSGGSTQQIICDWINGTQLSLVTNSLNIIARYENLDPLEVENTRLSVQVGHGARSGRTAPVVTIAQNEEFSPTEDNFYAIPPFVNRVKFLPASTPPNTEFFADFRFGIYTANSGAAQPIVYVLGSEYRDLFPDGLPVAGGGRFVRVTNTNVGLTRNLSIIGELAA